MAGVIVALLLLAGATGLIVFDNRAGSATGQARIALSGLYVSAVSGRLLQAAADGGSISVELGSDLLPGVRYSCPAGSTALLRGSIEEAQILIHPQTEIRVNEPESPEALTILAGSIELKLFGRSDGAGLTLGVRGRALAAIGPCSLHIEQGQQALLVKVFTGEVTYEAREGERRFPAGSTVVIDSAGAHVEGGRLLNTPDLIAPSPGSQWQSGTDILFRWGEVEGAAGYLLEIARDMLFEDVVLERSAPGPSVEAASPAEGHYFWRVRAFGSAGVVSDIAGPRHIAVRTPMQVAGQSTTAPKLGGISINSQSRLVIIRGNTESGARVMISLFSGERLMVESEAYVRTDGSFEDLQRVEYPGTIRVVIRAFYQPENYSEEVREVRVDF